jgi:hypothetical protein
MIGIFLAFTIKDWLIVVTSIILTLCILEIRRLKKSIVQEVQKRLLPQLVLEFNSDVNSGDAGFYLKNESFFIARKIQFEDAEFTLDDLGYKVGSILQFEGIDSLNPQEKAKLKFKVFDRDRSFLPDVTERIIHHLIDPCFKIRVNYSNIENLKSRVVFAKKKGKFYTESIKPCQ